jgi:aryl-alcohol dehydrogenase-like predicted oxidoreductase
MTQLGWLGLGSAQFGLNYGITNGNGIVSTQGVADILEFAESIGISLIDTASAYGSSESTIGDLAATRNFQVVTKIGDLPDTADDFTAVVFGKVSDSLSKLKRESIYGLLLHDGNILRTHQHADEIYKGLQNEKKRGRVQKIGVSVYDSLELKEVIENFSIDVVQIPLNLANQAFLLDGTIAALQKRAIEIHVRSVFLQGILLAHPSALPIGTRELQPFLEKAEQFYAKSKLTRLQACLKFIEQLHLGQCIIGVTSRSELQTIALACHGLPVGKTDFSSLHVENTRLTDPRNWR